MFGGFIIIEDDEEEVVVINGIGRGIEEFEAIEEDFFIIIFVLKISSLSESEKFV